MPSMEYFNSPLLDECQFVAGVDGPGRKHGQSVSDSFMTSTTPYLTVPKYPQQAYPVTYALRAPDTQHPEASTIASQAPIKPLSALASLFEITSTWPPVPFRNPLSWSSGCVYFPANAAKFPKCECACLVWMVHSENTWYDHFAHSVWPLFRFPFWKLLYFNCPNHSCWCVGFG